MSNQPQTSKQNQPATPKELTANRVAIREALRRAREKRGVKVSQSKLP